MCGLSSEPHKRRWLTLCRMNRTRFPIFPGVEDQGFRAMKDWPAGTACVMPDIVMGLRVRRSRKASTNSLQTGSARVHSAEIFKIALANRNRRAVLSSSFL
jgi:hypothetical protein